MTGRCKSVAVVSFFHVLSGAMNKHASAVWSLDLFRPSLSLLMDSFQASSRATCRTKVGRMRIFGPMTSSRCRALACHALLGLQGQRMAATAAHTQLNSPTQGTQLGQLVEVDNFETRHSHPARMPPRPYGNVGRSPL